MIRCSHIDNAVEVRANIEAGSIPVPESGCWIWLGAESGNGYTSMRAISNGKRINIFGHRASYLAFHGDLPKGMNVLHKCDVRACVNPAHLYAGTQGQNMQDMYDKKRRKQPSKENHARSKINREIAAFIMQSKISGRMLAKMFGLCPQYVSDIKVGKSPWSRA